jgi:isopenicillin-N epimerase
MPLPPRSPLAVHWGLSPDVVFLNHGSFGATPLVVLEHQQRLRARMEAQPVQFLYRDLEGLLDEARRELAAFVGADPEELAFVPNATTGVNAVVRSLALRPGDELLTTSHEYNACRNVLAFAAARAGARVVVAELPFPIHDASEITQAILSKVGPRTRLVFFDHVTSPTALVLPAAEIVRACRARGVATFVDGAHAPGMIDVDLRALGADFYVANCHKWLCAPKGCAMLFVRREHQGDVRPHVISHGHNTERTDRLKFLVEFDWVGTVDPTAYLCVGEALRFMASLVPGGWPEIRARNRALALEARRLLCDALSVAPPCPEDMIGSMVSLPLPDGAPQAAPTKSPLDPLAEALHRDHRIEIPVFPWPAPPRRLIRASAQLYDTREEYVYLADVLRRHRG